MQNLQLKLACYFFRLRLPFCDFVYIYLKIIKGRKPFSDLWFLRLLPSGLSPTSKNESTPYDVNFSYCLFLGMNVWQYSRNQEQELWSSILIMLMRQFVCFLYNKICSSSAGEPIQNCMVNIVFWGSFAELFAKVLNFIEILSDCTVK